MANNGEFSETNDETLSVVDEAVIEIISAPSSLILGDIQSETNDFVKNSEHVQHENNPEETDHSSGHDEQGQGYNEVSPGHSFHGHDEQGQGHSEPGQGHSEPGQGFEELSQGYSELSKGFDELSQGHSELDQGYDELGQGHKQQEKDHHSTASDNVGEQQDINNMQYQHSAEEINKGSGDDNKIFDETRDKKQHHELQNEEHLVEGSIIVESGSHLEEEPNHDALTDTDTDENFLKPGSYPLLDGITADESISDYRINELSTSSESAMRKVRKTVDLVEDHISDISEEDRVKQGETFQSILHALQDEHLKHDESDETRDSLADYAASDSADPQVEKPVIDKCPKPPKSPLLQDSMQDLTADSLPDSLNLYWTFGFNATNPVYSVVTDSLRSVFYTSSHVGVLYDYKTNQQTLLRGHSNIISCCYVSVNKRWLVTGDKGPNSLLIVWDSSSHIPIRSIFDCHADCGGVVACTLTDDSRFLATLSSNEGKTKNQRIAIWDWTTESEEPICTADIPESYGLQNYVLFNHADSTELVTNSSTQVLFYSWKTGTIDYYAPVVTDNTFNRAVGGITQSVFFSGHSRRSVSATDNGNVIIWDTNKPLSAIDPHEERTPNKKALKMVKLLEQGIMNMTTTDHLIVVGDAKGKVRFFDQELKLIHVYNNLFLSGPITNISFQYLPEFHKYDFSEGVYHTDCTIQKKPFIVRDFVVSTATGVIGLVRVDGTEIKILRKEHDAPVCAISTHPFLPMLAIGSFNGWLQIWQYTKGVVVASKKFEKGLQIQSLAYDPFGTQIAIGFTDGSIRVLLCVSMKEVSKHFKFKDHAILHITFSHNSEFMATADADSTVTLFRKGVCEKTESSAYNFVGRYKSHFKQIRNLKFGVKHETNECSLISIGDDRMLVEYDLKQSFKENLVLLSTDRIEQTAIPCSLTWFPDIGKESFFVTANSEYKLKMYNSITKMCRKTVLGPTIGSTLTHLEVVSPPANLFNPDKRESLTKPRSSEKLPSTDVKRYLAFLNNDKIGIMKLPLDGNPHAYSAFIAHPQGTSNLAVSYDGRFIFSAGGEDSSVHMWVFNPHALEAQAHLAGEGIKPFYSLLDGGRDGEEFLEIEQLFYYAQIKNQGINSSQLREVGLTVSLDEMPDMMRALGFYPTQEHIYEMLNEVRFSLFVETGEYTFRLDLSDFIKLYLNHRPAFGLELESVHQAFDVLSAHCANLQRDGWSARDGSQPSHRSSVSGSAPQGGAECGGEVDRDDLLELLQTMGEKMSEDELLDCLSLLVGARGEGGVEEARCGPHETPYVEPMDQPIEESLPLTFTASSFINSLLRMKLCDD